MDRPFGVELEMHANHSYPQVNGRGKKFVKLFPKPNGWSQGPGFDVEILPGWKVEEDPSCGLEFISPVLVNSDSVKKQIDKIKSFGFHPSFKRCGIHVHVWSVDFEEEDLFRLLRTIRFFDRTIYSFMCPKRFNVRFARMLGHRNEILERRSRGQGSQKYSSLNVSPHYHQGSVEFRYSEGHLDFEKIEALIHLFTSIVEFVKNKKKPFNCPPSIKLKRVYLLNVLGIKGTIRSTLLSCNQDRYRSPERTHNELHI